TNVPQQVELKTDVKTLNDLQKLLRAINWIQLLLGLTNDDLHSLFDILRRDPSLTSP
ncbi:POK8 protein, partial [Ciccaba nigrolineata]|nr:POK8 protein [Ciccaba nigrolineata]